MLSPTSNPVAGYAEALSRFEVYLDRVCRNYLYLQKKLKKGTDCAAVVKADAYGLGAAAVVPELYKANCRHFYVAKADDGLAVRAALKGQDAHVYVLNGPYGAAPKELAQNHLIPALNTLGDIEYWAGFARDGGQRQPAIIHLDTGMNRLGLSAVDVTRLKSNLTLLKSLDIRYVMSHLACADEPEHPKNPEQLKKFVELIGQLGLPCRLSLANSAGIFLGSDYHFDQVRPGCAIYGINPQISLPNPMQGTVALKARILQIRDAVCGETVGYGANYKLSSPAKLASISAGYADGLLRSFAGGGVVYINGQKCPVVGRVSMELIVADVTQVTPSPHEGGWAELIGEHQSVDDLAAAAKTIGYEILTSLGGKYKRIYSGQGYSCAVR
ncbi:MAG: alanine racemase [Proteobacteria bacterium]|nr:alanine racemase [Pseudomonadota bacterium]